MTAAERTKLAKALARGVLKVGDEPKRPTHRIAFKSLCKQGGEYEQGGLCEAALALVLEELLEKYGALR